VSDTWIAWVRIQPARGQADSTVSLLCPCPCSCRMVTWQRRRGTLHCPLSSSECVPFCYACWTHKR
jgi:hypothetical protein